jgi:hypothetical protein
MNPFFILLISSLAVFRLAEFQAVDNGPFHICKKIRGACKGHPVLCELITCQYCLGSWIAIVVTTGLVMARLIQFEHCILWWAGIWGGQAAILRIVRERT